MLTGDYSSSHDRLRSTFLISVYEELQGQRRSALNEPVRDLRVLGLRLNRKQDRTS